MPGPMNSRTAMLRAANWIRSILNRFDAYEDADLIDGGERLADELSLASENGQNDVDDTGEHHCVRDAIGVFRAQWREAKGDGPEITCPCGTRAPIRFLFRCLYCGVWFCQSCAEEHFGKKRVDAAAPDAGNDHIGNGNRWEAV